MSALLAPLAVGGTSSGSAAPLLLDEMVGTGMEGEGREQVDAAKVC